jgi:excisionase family DNA binding protein
MKTLTLIEAAEHLKMHPQTLRQLARAGKIPAAKPGRQWCFLEADLVAWLRGLYVRRWQVPQGRLEEATLWHFLEDPTPVTGGSVLRPPTGSRYANLLGLPTERRRGNTKTSAKPSSGDKLS